MKKNNEQPANEQAQSLEMARVALGRIKELDLTPEQNEKVMAMIDEAADWEGKKQLAKALNVYSRLKEYLAYLNVAEKISERKENIDYDKFECVKTLEGHKDRVSSVLETKDMKYIVSGSSDNNLKVWDRVSGKEIKTLNGHTKLIHAVKETADGQYLLSTSNDGTIKMWAKDTWECVRTFVREDEQDRQEAVLDVVEVDDHTLASISNAMIIIWDRDTGEEKNSVCPKGTSGTFYSLEKIANKDWLIITGDDITRIFNLTTNDWELGFGESSIGSCVAKESNDHKFIFTATSYKAEELYKIRMWNLFNWNVEAEFKGHQEDIKGMLQTKDGKHLITCANDKTIRVWEIATQECIKVFELDDFIPRCIAESANGDIIAGGADKTIKIFGIKK